jgi:hypothetical protein
VTFEIADDNVAPAFQQMVALFEHAASLSDASRVA